jgi:hypothetical protein
MTREVLEGSRSKKYKAQKAMVAQYASCTGLLYVLPGSLEAATVILSHYVRSGERLYANAPLTYTCCQELGGNQYPVVVGGFSSKGLVVSLHDFVVPTICSGVAGLRKFTDPEETDTKPAARSKSQVARFPSEQQLNAWGMRPKRPKTEDFALASSLQARLKTSEQVCEALRAENAALKEALKTESLILHKNLGALPPRMRALGQTSILDEAFGAKAWSRYFGEVSMEPFLPSDIDAILRGPCPFWAGKSVKDTHLLALIPSRVAGKPFSLNLLGELIEHPKGGGHPTQYDCYDLDVQAALGAQSAGGSYWVLMTRQVLQGSKSKNYASQKALIAAHSSENGLPYKLPGALEAVTVILSHYVRTGERLYSDSPLTYTRCQELVYNQYPVSVGGFASGGLLIHNYYSDFYDYDVGVASLRKF